MTFERNEPRLQLCDEGFSQNGSQEGSRWAMAALLPRSTGFSERVIASTQIGFFQEAAPSWLLAGESKMQ